MKNILDNAFWLWLPPLSWWQKRGGLWLRLQAAAWVPFAFSQTLPQWPLVGHLIFLCLQEIENNTSKWNENTFLSHSDIVRIKSFRLQSSRALWGGEMQKDPSQSPSASIQHCRSVPLDFSINKKQLRQCFQFTSMFCRLCAPQMSGHLAKHLKGDLRNKPSIFWLRQFL